MSIGAAIGPRSLAPSGSGAPLAGGTSLEQTFACALETHTSQAYGAYAANTLRAWRADVAQWRRWCAAGGVSYDLFPAAADQIAAFVDHAAARRAPATVRRYVASLALLHRAAGVTDPTDTTVVRLALRRMTRMYSARQRQAAPLTQRDIERILLATPPTTLRARRDRALVLVARDLLARRAELVALTVADVAAADDGSATTLIRRGKTDLAGEGFIGYLSRDAMDELTAWLAAGRIAAGPLFRRIRRHGAVTADALRADSVADIFQRLASAAGIRSPAGARVSGHSARIGMAQDLTEAGASLPELMQVGRWRDLRMPARYAERLLARRNAVAHYHSRPRGEQHRAPRTQR